MNEGSIRLENFYINVISTNAAGFLTLDETDEGVSRKCCPAVTDN